MKNILYVHLDYRQAKYLCKFDWLLAQVLYPMELCRPIAIINIHIP